MLYAILISSVVAPILAGLALLVRERRRVRRSSVASEVCRQYVYLFKGGHLSEAAVQSARVSLEGLLERGDIRQVEAGLRPGKQFAVQTRALTEIGTEYARLILERQLQRPLGADALEQGWYRLDLARCLRKLNRLPSMTALIRAGAGPDAPLIHFLAAEAASFPGFSGFMYHPDEPLGRLALVVLLRALRGLRCGVEPRVVANGRLGEAIAILWDQRLDGVDPMMVRVFVEVQRLLARSGHAERWYGADESGRAAFREQVALLEPVADGMADYLDLVADQLLDRLPAASGDEQTEILQALCDLRVDAGAVVISLLECGSLAARELAIESLMHARGESVGRWLCNALRRHTNGQSPARSSFPVLPALRALRNFPSAAAESILLAASSGHGPDERAAALSSLGWWSPLQAGPVLARLKEARFDRVPAVMTAAQAALARLGERHALRWFRQQLAGETPEPIHRVIQLIAEEGILLLWPDLDCLADAEDSDIAFHACEALEHLREQLSVSRQPR